MISNRYAKANNKYMMGTDYDQNKLSKYLIYLDANNLDGWAMSQKLPKHGFEFMDNEECELWRNMPCILEVDLEYLKDLHNLHNDYPLASEHIRIKNGIEKLIPNLNNKRNYIIHHETLNIIS